MSAAEEEGLGVGGFGEGFLQVDFQDFVGDGVVDPAFFDERDEQGAGFFVGFEVEGGESSFVGVGFDGGLGCEDEDCGGWCRFSPDRRQTQVLRLRPVRLACGSLRGCAQDGTFIFISSRSREGGLGAGFDYSDDGDGDGLPDVFEG